MKNKPLTHRSIAVLLTTLLLMVAIPVASAFAAAPAQYAAAGSNVAFTGSSDSWSNTGSVAGAPDDARAQATITNSGNVSAYLQATTAANTFSIPSDATIKGIQVAIERSSVCQTTCTSSVTDSRIRIVKGGAVQTTDRSLATAWPTTDTVANYGTTSDLWGTTWLPSDINSAGFGVAIAATRSNGGARIARVDSVMITVTYTRPTSTTVASSKASSTYGESITLTATVNQSAATGSVEFYDGLTLLGTGALNSGTATFDINNLATGSHSITAKYVGDSTYVTSTSSSITQSVEKADAACTITGFAAPYDKLAHGASGTCKGVFDESAGTLDLGTSYTDFPGGTAHWTFTGNSNYNDQTGDVLIDISKADASCAITGFAGSYDGTAHGAGGSCSGVGGESAGTLDLGATFTSVPGGSAHWAFTGNNNYKDQSGDVAIDISKADATCSVTGFAGSYDGTAHGAGGSCSGVGGEDAGTLDLGASYTDFPGGSAHWTFTGNDNYKDQSGDVAIDISKADATCAVKGFSGSYDGAAHGASGSCSGVGSESAGTLDLGASYTDYPGGSAHWSFTGNNNYKDQSGDVAIEISKAEAVTVVLPYDVTYDGSAHVATGTVTGVNDEDLTAGLDLSATSHTDAASYAGDVWTFTAPNANYKDASGTVDNKISPADAVIVVNSYNVTFDGSAHTSSGTATGVMGEDLSTNLDLSATNHTDIGEYNDAWSFTAPNANYNDKSGTVKNLISAKLIPALILSGGPFTYDGNPHAATVTSPVSGAVSDIKYIDSAAVSSSDAPVNAGTYTVTADFLPVDTVTYETLNDVTAGTITIEKALPSCTVNAYTVTYDGASHTATGSCLGVGDVVLTGLDLSATTHTDAGTYDDSWTFTDVTGNYNDDSGTVQNVISADTTAPVVSSAVRADANNTSATRVHFTVTFSEAVTGVNMSAPYADFSLFTTGLGGASITEVSGSGATYNVTVNTGVGSGTIRLDVVDDDSILDVVSNPLGGSGNGNGNFTGQTYTIVKAPSFADVSASNPYYQDIEILYANGLTGGCGTSPLKFCPDKTMNRGEAAVFILRGTYGASFTPSPATHIFKDDWSKGSWAEPWAEAMRATGLSAGCFTNPLRYCPWDQMPREQVVIFALRLKYGVSYTPPPATGTVFADMTNASYYATAWAEQAYKDGLISNCGMSGGKPKFCPKDGVSRGLAAHVIVTAKNLSMP